MIIHNILNKRKIYQLFNCNKHLRFAKFNARSGAPSQHISYYMKRVNRYFSYPIFSKFSQTFAYKNPDAPNTPNSTTLTSITASHALLSTTPSRFSFFPYTCPLS